MHINPSLCSNRCLKIGSSRTESRRTVRITFDTSLQLLEQRHLRSMCNGYPLELLQSEQQPKPKPLPSLKEFTGWDDAIGSLSAKVKSHHQRQMANKLVNVELNEELPDSTLGIARRLMLSTFGRMTAHRMRLPCMESRSMPTPSLVMGP